MNRHDRKRFTRYSLFLSTNEQGVGVRNINHNDAEKTTSCATKMLFSFAKKCSSRSASLAKVLVEDWSELVLNLQLAGLLFQRIFMPDGTEGEYSCLV